jgi:NADH-quinone oxidoreductase subunit E
MPFSEDVRSRLDADAAQIIGKYPRPRSALLPLLHLVQSEEGFVSADGIGYCAAKFGLTEAEVTAVVSFYTMYKRRPVGEYHVGVCTNTLCAVMGGDQIFAELTEHLGIGNDETTPDGKVMVEHIECNAACDYAPIMTVNWEFFDNMTPGTARQLVDDLRAGNQVSPTRGPSRLCTWKQASRILAGFGDGQATDGPTAGPASLVGLTIAHERGWTAPHPASTSGNGAPHAGAEGSAGSGPAGSGVSPADSSSPMPGKSPAPGRPPEAGKSPKPRGSARSRSAGQKSSPGASESSQPEQESP